MILESASAHVSLASGPSLRTMTSGPSIHDLMRVARGSYGRAIAARFAAEGIDDLPRDGGFVLAYLADGEESVEAISRGVGITREAVRQVIDALVVRGYATRGVHPEDRRRTVVEPTDRGRAAADAIGASAHDVDEQLAERLSPAELAGLRAGLAVLGEI
jgi:DNA-binding MarR family transcriptional regulator